jgi:hypothetical protein
MCFQEGLMEGVSVDHTYSVELKEEAILSPDEAFADGSDSNSRLHFTTLY